MPMVTTRVVPELSRTTEKTVVVFSLRVDLRMITMDKKGRG